MGQVIRHHPLISSSFVRGALLIFEINTHPQVLGRPALEDGQRILSHTGELISAFARRVPTASRQRARPKPALQPFAYSYRSGTEAG